MFYCACKRWLGRHIHRKFSTARVKPPKVCIIGSGPAGFYTAQQLIKILGDVQVDIYEGMPVPFGLVRYGVAPDHPEVKNVTHTFTKIAHSPNVRFVGNVSIGRDATLDELRQAYHAVHLTYGAEQDRELGVPGEHLGNVLSARRVVGWYNGVPWDRDLRVDLEAETCAVLGQGNVALDVARILLTPVDALKSTDITEHALAALARSKVKEVVLIGRRGPLQAAFTIKEFREMLHLPGCRAVLDPGDFAGVREEIPVLSRPRRRLTELLCKTAFDRPGPRGGAEPAGKSFRLVFFRTPKMFVPRPDNPDVVGGVELLVNRLEGTDADRQRAVPTGAEDTVECGLAMRSIGYRSVKADPEIPFDDTRGRVKNSHGVVEPGLYSAGWVATGPMGVILSTMTNAFTVAQAIAADLRQGAVDVSVDRLGFERVGALLRSRGVQWVSFAGWERIDAVERERGARAGKPREKILDIKEMLAIAASGS
ncbi:NADPH:adrenodoxin oxidoreductase, mitochondrial isoform X2 [Bacillus rossius redtenbacheri]|uniref:NADPH:adrenodoxin oxidoreductase, mitochondrial isoform X2 n=1 Tax=Bacillus rossius redtenbacheri TaxID=93214 RepID=UPI002FDD1237